VVALLLMALVGCEKKSGNAVVVGKDYAAAVKEGEEIKDARATDREQWIVKVRMRDNAVRSKSTPIEHNGRNYAKRLQ
jgi:hypothetical protein